MLPAPLCLLQTKGQLPSIQTYASIILALCHTHTYINTQTCLCHWSCCAGNTPSGTGITGHSRAWGHQRHSGTIQAWWLFKVSLSPSLILGCFTVSYCLHQPQVKSKSRKWTFLILNDWSPLEGHWGRPLEWREPHIEYGLKFTWQLRKNAFLLLIHPLNHLAPPLLSSAWAIKSPSWPCDLGPQP